MEGRQRRNDIHTIAVTGKEKQNAGTKKIFNIINIRKCFPNRQRPESSH